MAVRTEKKRQRRGRRGAGAGSREAAGVQDLIRRVKHSPIALVPKHRITPHPENSRKGDVPTIQESIVANGFYGACLVQKKTGYILVGSHRYMAACAEGAIEIPVIYLDVNPAVARRIMMVDNRANDLAGYDREGLAALLAGISLEGTGYTTEAAEAVGAAVADIVGGERPDDFEQPNPKEPDTKVEVGSIRFLISHSEYLRWRERVRRDAGFSPEAVVGELLRTLGLASKSPRSTRSARARTTRAKRTRKD